MAAIGDVITHICFMYISASDTVEWDIPEGGWISRIRYKIKDDETIAD